MTTATIRQLFIDFFTKKGHTALPAAPIVQQDDPTLLFVNAGMNPFKNIFLGSEAAKDLRVVDSQPCLRVTGKHNDLEEVGVDTYHHTLFEMLGNWSFGDYFKKEAIDYAWELLTKVYAIPAENLYVTVFEGDNADGLAADKEAYDLWTQYLPKERILYASKKDNFWEMGATGPCGPCTEIHVDIRSAAEKKKVGGHTLVNQDHPHVIEIWNLVFIQYQRKADGSLEALPTCHVDTGMGLERLAMVLQGKQSNYDTDAFQPLIQAVAEKAAISYGQDATKDIALRVAADHIRAISFAIADGALPSNQQAGYVVRRLLRRAVRYGYQHLGLQEPFLYQLVDTLIQQMGKAYPSLQASQELIEKVILQEETNFLRTLEQGLKQFAHLHAQMTGTQLEGEAVFQLYDTYGFPVDLTALMAREKGMTIDQAGFERAMQAQKERSKKAAEKAYGDWHAVSTDASHSQFVGYDQLTTTSILVAYRSIQKQGKTFYQLVFDKTPFYPNGGGQVGDTGFLYSGEKKIAVLDTRKEEGQIIHLTTALPDSLDTPVKAVVDRQKRTLAANNHTATHLLDAALRQVLGAHITQRGSYLDAERLRFDFTHPMKLTQAELDAIEQLVNEKIRANIPRVEERAIPFSEAEKKGAIMLPGEQYGEKVRMITFDPAYSVALCGGTHVPATGQIGFFKIIAESGVAAGIRRIEALTATAAEQWVQATYAQLSAIQALLKNPQETVKAVENLQKAHKKTQKELEKYHRKALDHAYEILQKSVTPTTDAHVAIAQIEIPAIEACRKLAARLSKAAQPLLLIVATTIQGQAYLAVYLSSALEGKYHAQEILQQLAPAIQGKGGRHRYLRRRPRQSHSWHPARTYHR